MYGDGKTADHPDDAGKFAGEVFSNIEGAHFKNAQMKGARLVAVQGTGSDFSGAVLDGASFSRAQLEAAPSHSGQKP